MVRSIHELPDDIIACIFSLLTIRDAFRARLSSRRWRHLPDTRSVVVLDSLNVFGKEIAAQDQDKPAVQSKFAGIVRRFLRIWSGEKLCTLTIKFVLGKEHYSHVKCWIGRCVEEGVEEVELNFFSGRSQKRYAFHGFLINFEDAPCLRRLYLKYCALRPAYFNRPRWLSNLTSLELVYVPLHQRGWDFILSAGTNLTSLRLYECELPSYLCIDGQLFCLKKLTVVDHLSEIVLNCPSLETFKYSGLVQTSMRFVHVPVLREAELLFALKNESCSVLFSHLIRQAPNLEALTLRATTEVKPILSTFAARSLKKLVVSAPCGHDLLSVTNLINASPLLETLQVQMGVSSVRTVEKREYSDHTHYRLKEVKIVAFRNESNGIELAMYIVRNAVALEKMFIATTRNAGVREKVKSLRRLQETINPTAKLGSTCMF